MLLPGMEGGEGGGGRGGQFPSPYHLGIMNIWKLFGQGNGNDLI